MTISAVLKRRGLDELLRAQPRGKDMTQTLLDALTSVTEAEMGAAVADAFAQRALRTIRVQFAEPVGSTHVQTHKARQLAGHMETLWGLVLPAAAQLCPNDA
jgi:hypothetical protein